MYRNALYSIGYILLASVAWGEDKAPARQWKLAEKKLDTGKFSLVDSKDKSVRFDVQCFVYATSDHLAGVHREQRAARQQALDHDKRMASEAPEQFRASYRDSLPNYERDFAATVDTWRDWRFPVFSPHLGDKEWLKRALVGFQCVPRERDVALLMTCSHAVDEREFAAAAHLVATECGAMKPDDFQKLPHREQPLSDDKVRKADFGKFFEDSLFLLQH